MGSGCYDAAASIVGVEGAAFGGVNTYRPRGVSELIVFDQEQVGFVPFYTLFTGEHVVS